MLYKEYKINNRIIINKKIIKVQTNLWHQKQVVSAILYNLNSLSHQTVCKDWENSQINLIDLK